MNLEKIRGANTQYLGKEIIYKESIDSTQKEVYRIIKDAKQKLKNVTIIITDNQTNGIGTKGRIWYCTRGENIAMSIILFPNCKLEKMRNITKDIAECMINTIMDLYKINLIIKEPNDLLLNNKKICGILRQSSSMNGIVNSLVIGIGFNVNQLKFPKEIKEIATSLKNDYNKEYNREEIIAKFLEKLEVIIGELKN